MNPRDHYLIFLEHTPFFLNTAHKSWLMVWINRSHFHTKSTDHIITYSHLASKAALRSRRMRMVRKPGSDVRMRSSNVKSA